MFPLVSFLTSFLQKQNMWSRTEAKRPGVSHLDVADGEDDRVGQVDFVGVLVDGGRDDGRVDDDRVVGGHGLAAQLHAVVLRGQVDPDVFVEDEGYPDLTCRGRRQRDTHSHIVIFTHSVAKLFHVRAINSNFFLPCLSLTVIW